MINKPYWPAILCLLVFFWSAAEATDKNDLLAPSPALTARDPLGLWQSEDELLEADQAFIVSVIAADPQTLMVRWDIAEGYYLYRDKLKLSLPDAEGISITTVDIPMGEFIEDEHFGRQQVFYRQATATAHLQRDWNESRDLNVQVDFQGCAEIGVCYPPMRQTIPVNLAALDASATPPPMLTANAVSIESEQDQTARMLMEQRFWSMPAFFGFGLLLAFTPCVFPMIPILSSLIAGQGEKLTQRHAFLLSLVYILAMALTYTVAGVLAALLGQNIQALFQNSWILVGFSALFVLLALSMFGFYELQLPSRWQSRLIELSNSQRSGSYAGVAVMGLLSALIVGPCVAPPLIGVLTVIAATGDVVLGGTALFAISLGMGLPLLVIGTSAGRLLPRAGHWMNRIKAGFGVLLLAVAIWILERVLPVTVSMLLWATLLIVTATYMGALQPISHGMPAWRTLVKGLGTMLMIYGVLLLVGVAAGGKDPLQPLRGVSFVSAGEKSSQDALSFQFIKTTADLDRELSRADGRAVLLDFYADWCVSCKEMEKYTFSDAGVQAALANTLLLKADVTANDAADQALLHRFGIIGPPAILFFGPDGSERRAYRVVGFMAAERFKSHLQQVRQSNQIAFGYLQAGKQPPP